MRPHRLALALMLVLSLVACSATAAPATQAPSVSAPSVEPSPPVGDPSPAGGGEIGCDLGGHDDAYHIHSLVLVKSDGQLYSPPANVGISQTCMSWVHTHKTDGIVHVEAPASVTPTLGNFLDLWESTYPDDQLLAQAREAVAAGQVTIDDAPYDGNASDLALADQLRIVLGD